MALAVTATTLTTVIVFLPDRVRRRRRGPDLPRPGARGRLQPHGVDGRGDGRSCRCSRRSTRSRRRDALASRWTAFGRVLSLRPRHRERPRALLARPRRRAGFGARVKSLLWTVPLVPRSSSRSSSSGSVIEAVVLVLVLVVAGLSSSSARSSRFVAWPFLWLFDRASARSRRALAGDPQGRAAGAAAHRRRRRGPHLARLARDPGRSSRT